MHGVQVKNFEAFRRSLPEGSRLIVSKNTLLCALHLTRALHSITRAGWRMWRPRRRCDPFVAM